MFNELKKFVNDNPIRVTMCEKTGKAYAYTFSGNTVAYYELDGNVDVYNDLILPNANDFDDINEAIHSEDAIYDENPFDFYTDDCQISEPKEVSANKFVKALASFTKFYDTDNIHREYRGIHINNGNMFATNSYVMRIVESNVFDKDVNMVIDFNPMVSYMDINTKKIKTTGKSLFATKKSKNDSVVISTYVKGYDDILKVEYKGLTFINHSICKSELDFTFIKQSTKNLDKTIKVYKNDLYRALNNLLGQSIKDPNKVKNAFVFEQENDKILIYPYIKFTETRHTLIETVNSQSDFDTKLVTNGENLLNVLKQISDEIIEIKFNSESRISKISSKTSKEDYYIIFTV